MEFLITKPKLLSVAFCWFICVSLTSAATPSNETDSLSLMAFRGEITDDPFGVLSSWNDSVHFCSWEGVSCGQKHRQRVVSLVLTHHRLAGTVSPSIGNLTFLRTLNLSNNFFQGRIPPQIDRLFRLQILVLTDNSFKGTLPANLSYLTNLREIRLKNNKISGIIPEELGNLQNLRFLHLHGNELSGNIPHSLGNLSSLTQLILYENELVGSIPRELGQVQNLQIFAMHTNKLNGTIPSEIYNLSNLNVFAVDANKFHGRLPSDIGLALPKLEWFGFSSNELSGNIPPSLGNLSSLTDLILFENELVGSIPRELGQLHNLRTFRMFANKLNGTIPYEIYNFSNLNEFEVAANKFHGRLPSYIGLTLPNLERLGFAENEFSGPIPISLLNCSKLTHLVGTINRLSGPVPRDIGRLNNLYGIFLGVNNLGSNNGDDLDFLSSLTNCTNLQTIYFARNNLRGCLPDSITNLSSRLLTLRLEGNQIFGKIPSGIGNLIGLESLNLFHNNITGNIPDDVSKLKNLQQLRLNNNNLTGEIPLSLGNLPLLSSLWLNNNNLHGRIPLSIGRNQSLTDVDTSYNNLNGGIPIQLFAQNSQLIYLILSHNAFSGALPLQVGNLRHLDIMDVSDNRLSGGIPPTLGGCESLSYLNLRGNLFQGPIPQALSTLRAIDFLDVSNNNLIGNIPQFLEKLRLLIHLNLSHNDLEGQIPNEGVFRNTSIVTLDGNDRLCGGIPEMRLPSCLTQSTRKNEKKSLALKVIVPIVVVTIALVVLACFSIMWHKRSGKKPASTSSFDPHILRVSYGDLLKATNSFAEENLIGIGSFGSVYKGILDDEERVIAVKVLNLQRRGGSKSFMSECDALKNVRHRNLVKILTACSTVDFQGNDFKALVFVFMPNGSLDRWLNHAGIGEPNELRILNLVQRLNIAIDIALALEYLHHDCEPTIVHCDLKPSNVLLDGELTAHVSDFGLAKVLSLVSENSAGQNGSSSLAIKGSVGYVPPEYGMRGEVSTQGDVYSYGILLLEMFTGKKPTNDMFMNGLSLHTYVKTFLPEKVREVVDSGLVLDENNDGRLQECLISIMRIGVACSSEAPSDRMDIRDVVNELKSIKVVYETPRFDSF